MAAPPIPACPRCRYDLSGIAATWEQTGQCPLRGTCSECGAAFPWSDRFVTPEQRARAAHFEFAPRPGAGSLLRTAFLALRPSRFWLGVRAEDQVQRRRLLPLAFFGTLATYAAVEGAAAAIVLGRYLDFHFWRAAARGVSGPFSSTDYFRSARRCLLPLHGVNFTDGVPTRVSAPITFALAVFLLAPCALRLLPREFRGCDPGPPVLARAWACGFIALPIALGFDVLLSTILRTFAYIVNVSGYVPWSTLLNAATRIERWHGPIAAALVLGWTFVWWRAALAHSLGARAPARVAAATVGLGILIALLIAMLPPGARAWLSSST